MDRLIHAAKGKNEADISMIRLISKHPCSSNIPIRINAFSVLLKYVINHC